MSEDHSMQSSANRRRRLAIFFALWIAAMGIFAIAAIKGPGWIRDTFAGMPETYLLRCRQQMREGRFQDAELESRAAIERDPYDFEAHYFLAESLRMQNRLDEAYAVLGSLEAIVQSVAKSRLPVKGYYPGRFFYRMALIDFEIGRFAQGLDNLLRAIDEAPDYIDNAPEPFENIRETLYGLLQQTHDPERIAFLCRAIDAIGERIPARQILQQIALQHPQAASLARMIEAELNLLAISAGVRNEEVDMLMEAARQTLETTADNDPDRFMRLWAAMVLGDSRFPVRPIPDAALREILEDAPVALSLPSDLSPGPGTPAEGFFIGPASFNLYQPGTITAEIELDAPVGELWLMARGSNAMGVWPYIIIRINGQEIARRYLNLFAYKPYRVEVALEPGTHAIEIQYLNDEFNLFRRTDSNVYIRAMAWMP